MNLAAQDYQEIKNLIYSYAYHLDHGDLKRMSQLFSHATVYMSDRVIKSDPAAVENAFADFIRLYSGVPRTRHVMSNIIITPERIDRAHSTNYVMVFQQTDVLPLQPIIGGDYRDRFAKVDGVWRFVERRISNDLFGNLSAHGRFAYGPEA
jgi:3-phenylpropionate/cinnamic acid dioxygenase small subunit